MEEDVMVTTEAPARNGETPRTFQIRPQQSYRLIVTFQLFSFKGVRSNQEVDCCVSIDCESATDGNNERKGGQDKRSKCHPHTSEQGAHSPVVYEEGQARSRASDHKHPVTPVTTEETVEGGGKRVEYEDRRNTKGKVSTSTTKFVEGHGRSRATNGERDDSPRPDDAEADGPGGGKTEPNAYQTPSQTEHTWHKSSKEDKVSKHIFKNSQARKYVEKGNEALRTKNKRKRTPVTTIHDVNIRSEVRGPERPTSCNKNIAGARPDVCGARGKYGGGGAPNWNNDRTLAHPKSESSKAETTKGYGNRDGQYGGDRSRRLDIHHDDEIRNDEECQKGFSGWQMPGLDRKVSKIQMCKDLMSSYKDFINGPETNNIAHGGALPPDTNTDDPSTSTLVLEKFETAQQASCETVQNEFETIQQSGQR